MLPMRTIVTEIATRGLLIGGRHDDLEGEVETVVAETTQLELTAER